MASRLVAAIESTLRIKPTLVEGHDGIYEVSLGDELIYTNQSTCAGGFPEDQAIVNQLGQHLDIQPIISDLTTDEIEAPSCPVPETKTPESSPSFQSACGCGAPAQSPASGDKKGCGSRKETSG